MGSARIDTLGGFWAQDGFVSVKEKEYLKPATVSLITEIIKEPFNILQTALELKHAAFVPVRERERESLSGVVLPVRFRIVTRTPATNGTFVAKVTVRVLALAGKKVLCEIFFTTKAGWYTLKA